MAPVARLYVYVTNMTVDGVVSAVSLCGPA